MPAALVLVVLTLVGAAPAAGAALPVGALNSLASTVAHTPDAPAPSPKTDRTPQSGGPHHDLRRTRAAPSAAGPGTGGRNARDHQRGPDRPPVRTGPARPYAPNLHERSSATDPATHAPRAGISRAHLTGHAPPPSYDGLPACPSGLIVPRGHAERVTATSSGTPSGRRGALPGVRGPPGTSTGPSTGHWPCSADQASRPR
ncbi:hypothetical protein [Streptomyces sp. NPDC007346]|uniref:hypothetical protein n=1 Tax=Streptomyces sp. NPDC007346 TaxID=3154682 RepID=UPI00345182A1